MNSNILINHFLIKDINNLDLIDAFLDLNIDVFLPSLLKELKNCEGLIFFNKNLFILEYSTLLFLWSIATLKQSNNLLIVSLDLGLSASVYSIFVNSLTYLEEDIITETHNNLLPIEVNNYDIVHDKFKDIRVNLSKYSPLINGTFYQLFNNYLNFLNNYCIVDIQRKNNLSQIVNLTKKHNIVVWDYYKHCNTNYLKGLGPTYCLSEM